MLTRKTPETITAEFNIIIAGAPSEKLEITFWNKRQKDIDKVFFNASNHEAATAGDMQYASRQAFLFVVKAWKSEYELTDDGVAEAEADHPGLIQGVFLKYHDLRRVEVTKN